MRKRLTVVAVVTLFLSMNIYADEENCDHSMVREDTIDLIAIDLGVKAEQEHKEHFTHPASKNGKKIPWTLKDKHEIAEFVEDIMRKSEAARHDQGKTKLLVESKELAGDRIAWWENKTGTVVIFNPNKKDCGTAFRPDDGKAYYDAET